MKLSTVYAGAEAWQRLVKMTLPPLVAFQLAKYSRSVAAEIDLVERQRIQMIRKLAGVGENDNASLAAGGPEHARFMSQFGELLAAESDLKRVEMTFGDFLKSLEMEKDNRICAQDIVALEPFFLT